MLIKRNFYVVTGEVYELAAAATGGYEIVWSSSDESVATVTQQGEVTAVAGGQAEITASAASANAVCTVTVDPILLKGERRLLWNDEFDGDALNGSKWGYQLGVQNTYKGQVQLYLRIYRGKDKHA